MLRRSLSLAGSPIGRGISRPIALAMALLGIAVALVDLQLLPWRLPAGPWWTRGIPAWIAVAAFAVLVRRADAIGARLRPLPSVGYWVRATLLLAALFAVIVGIAFAIQLATSTELRVPDPGPFTRGLWSALGDAPIVEESIYRWALVTGIAALGLRWPAVALSGIAFGWAHVMNGVGAANNIAAGFVFAWMYLRSGSIAVPIAFHSLGNLTVLLLNQLAYAVLS